jgi:flavin-dependent dehydrogenase
LFICLYRITNNRKIRAIEDEAVVSLIEKGERICGVKTCSGREILARYVIDCSGAKRFSGKKLRFKERRYSAPLISYSGVIPKSENVEYKENKAVFFSEIDSWTWIATDEKCNCT